MARGKGLARHTARLEEEEGPDCPLCIEPLDAHEQDWYPCTCGYQVCAFCYQRLQLENNNQCPGCRTEYGTRKEPLQKSEGRHKASPAKSIVRASPKHAAIGVLSPRSTTESMPNGTASSPAANGTAANIKGPSKQPNGQPAIQQTSAPAKQATAGLDSYPECAGAPGESSSEAANGYLVQTGDTGGGGTTRTELEDPRVAQANSKADLEVGEPTDSSSGEAAHDSQLAVTGGLGRTTNWAGRKAAGSNSANLQTFVPAPSPSKWPELGTTVSAANSAGVTMDLATDPPAAPPRQSQPGTSGQQQQQGSSGGIARLITPGAGNQRVAVGPLWRQLLPRTTPEMDPQGSALREAITTAVQSGKLNSREGARQLVAYLAMAGKHWEIEGTKAAGQQAEAQLQQQQEQQQREKQEAELEHLQQLLQRQQLQDQQLQQSVSSGSAQEPQQRSWLTESIPGPGAVGGPLRNGLAPGLLHAHSRGDSFSAGNAGLGRDNRHSIFDGLGEPSSTPRSSAWLQSGIISGLGLSAGSGGSGMGDLWGPPSKQPSSSSIWGAPKHLDADAVPDSLQELWANSNAKHGGNSNLATSKASLFSDRNSVDSLGSLGKDSSLSSSLGRHSHVGNGYSSNLGAIGMQPGLASQSTAFGGAFSQAGNPQGYSQGLAAGLGSSVLQASQGYLQGMLEKPTASGLGLSHGYTAGLGHASLAASQGYSQGWGGSQGNFQAGLGAPLGYSQGLGGSQVYSQGLGPSGGLPQGLGGASLGFSSGLAVGLGTPVTSQTYSQLGHGHGLSSQHNNLGDGAGSGGLADRLAESQQSFGSNSLLSAGHAPMGQQQRLQDLWNNLGGVSRGQPQRPQQQLQSLAQQGLYGQQALQQQQTLQLQNLHQQQQHNWQGRSSPGFGSLNVGSRLYQQ